jgi:hypothetical protein
MTVLVAPIVSKATMVAEKNDRGIPRPAGRHQERIRAAVELLFKSSRLVQVLNQKGKEAFRTLQRPPAQRAQGLREPEAGRNQLRGGNLVPIVKTKPTSPGRRAMVKIVTPDCKGRPVDALTESQKRGSGATTRPHHHAPQGRWPQDAVPDRRLSSQQGRNQGEDRASRARPESQRALALLCYADGERRYILRRGGAGRGADERAEAPIRASNTLPIRNIPVDVDPLHRMLPAGARSWRGRRELRCGCWRRHHARTALGEIRVTSTAAPRSARSATKSTACARSARPVPTAGAAFARRCVASV